MWLASLALTMNKTPMNLSGRMMVKNKDKKEG